MSAIAPRRSSINEDLLRRRFSSSSEVAVYNNIRTSSLLGAVSESESLLLSAADENKAYIYGSVAEIDEEEEDSQTQQHHDHRRLSLTKDSKLLQDEMKSMIELALPVCLTYLLEMLPGITTIILVGRMKEDGNKLHIDATALAVMFINIIGMSTGLGLLTAMDTLCSQAHGANQPSKMGTYLLTGMFVMMITFVIVGVIIWNTTPILLACGQQHDLAMEAGSFAQYMLPSVPFVYAYEILRKISQARNEATPMMVSAIVSNIVNIGLGYYLVNCTAWGWLGAAVARSVGSLFMLPSLILSMMYCERGEATTKVSNDDDEEKKNTNEVEVMDAQLFHHLWEGFQPSKALSIKAVLKFLDLGLPGMLQVMFEWVAFEVIALICGIIPDQEEALIAIGSNAIVLNIVTFAYMLYLGTGVAGNVRIGNALGAGDAHRAQVATYLAVAIGTFLSLVNIVLIVTFREYLASIFTNDEDLLNKCRSLFIIVALFQLPDAINGVEQGVFRASGRQSLSAKLNFVAYYVIGLPLGYYLALPLELGVEGLWIGIFVGMLVISSTNSIVIMRSDWAALATAARSRLSIVVPSKDLP
jgi:MATE family multidrug resistance protein